MTNLPVFHVGRAWAGTALEDGCPCPKAPCGLVDTAVKPLGGCPQHAMNQSIRQSHTAADCPDPPPALVDVAPAGLAESRPQRRRLSMDRRRTIRQREALAVGQHPLAAVGILLRLHPDAARVTGPNQRDEPGLRCGSCRFRQLVHGGAKDYPKCVVSPAGDGRAPRASHGSGTDVRAWWPACTDYQPKEST